MSKSDDKNEKTEKAEAPVVDETEYEQAGNKVQESTLVELTPVKDPTVNQKTKSYPPKPTDGKTD